MGLRDELGGPVGVAARPAQQHPERDDALLHAVVQVPFDAAPLVVDGRDDRVPGARQLLHAPREPLLAGGGEHAGEQCAFPAGDARGAGQREVEQHGPGERVVDEDPAADDRAGIALHHPRRLRGPRVDERDGERHAEAQQHEHRATQQPDGKARGEVAEGASGWLVGAPARPAEQYHDAAAFQRGELARGPLRRGPERGHEQGRGDRDREQHVHRGGARAEGEARSGARPRPRRRHRRGRSCASGRTTGIRRVGWADHSVDDGWADQCRAGSCGCTRTTGICSVGASS